MHTTSLQDYCNLFALLGQLHGVKNIKSLLCKSYKDANTKTKHMTKKKMESSSQSCHTITTCN